MIRIKLARGVHLDRQEQRALAGLALQMADELAARAKPGQPRAVFGRFLRRFAGLRRASVALSGDDTASILAGLTAFCADQARLAGWQTAPPAGQLLADLLDHLARQAGMPGVLDCNGEILPSGPLQPVLLPVAGQVGWLQPAVRDRLREQLAGRGLLQPSQAENRPEIIYAG